MELRRTIARLVVGALVATMTASGCVREVLSGEDPEVQTPKLSGDSSRDELVVNIPWMQAPVPRLLLNDRLQRTEMVFGRSPDAKTLYTLRTPTGRSASVEITTKYLPNDIIDFTYRITSMPPEYMMDVVVPMSATDVRPAAELSVNGAVAKIGPATEVAVVTLSRDAPTKLVVRPLVAPAPEPATAPASAPAAGPTTPPTKPAAAPTASRTSP